MQSKGFHRFLETFTRGYLMAPSSIPHRPNFFCGLFTRPSVGSLFMSLMDRCLLSQQDFAALYDLRFAINDIYKSICIHSNTYAYIYNYIYIYVCIYIQMYICFKHTLHTQTYTSMFWGVQQSILTSAHIFRAKVVPCLSFACHV